MRRERSQRREKTAAVQMQIQEAERSGVLVADLKEVSFSYGERPIFTGFTTTIMRGDKIGIIGRNGSGKTTLLRVLLGQLPPTAGKVRLGTNLQLAYFDQLRRTLDEEKSVQENVGDGYDTVRTNGGTRHIIGYLQDFLFSPDRARTPVRLLSGGERNRVLLAKLFAKPANVIVLDEPTNDLDSETLELLEELLAQFSGTVLLVSHDREFLNNVVGSTIVFEQGNVKEYVGGYDDWLAQRPPPQAESAAKAKAKPAAAPPPTPPVTASGKRKPSFKEKRERELLPGRIEQLEADIHALHGQMADPAFYQQPGDKIAAETARAASMEEELNAAYERWAELEELGE
jgi:ATP-binding cassette subfamily F protein uup